MDKELLDYTVLKSFKDYIDKDTISKTDTMKNDLSKDYVSKSDFEELKKQVVELQTKLAGNWKWIYSISKVISWGLVLCWPCFFVD